MRSIGSTSPILKIGFQPIDKVTSAQINPLETGDIEFIPEND